MKKKSFVNRDTRFRDYFGDSSIILYGITGLLWDCLRRRGSAYCHECADPDSCLYGAYCAGYYPERVNGLSREVCTGAIRRYTIRMVELIKLVFVLSLLFTSICDALGYRVDAAYSLIVMGLILVVAVVFEVKIIKNIAQIKIKNYKYAAIIWKKNNEKISCMNDRGFDIIFFGF